MIRATVAMIALGIGLGTPAVATAKLDANVIAVRYKAGNPFLDAFVAIPKSVDDAARSGKVDFGLQVTVTYSSQANTVETVDSGHRSIKLDTTICAGGPPTCPSHAKGTVEVVLQVPLGAAPPPGPNPGFSPTAQILDPGCTSSKYNATGKKCSGKLKCVAKGALNGAPPDTTCLAKASDKFSSSFGKAELKGGCPTTGDASAIESKVDAHVDDLRHAVWSNEPTRNLCASAKLRAAGKKCACKLKCTAKAALTGTGVDPNCVSTCEQHFSNSFDTAQARGGCTTSGDAPAIEGKVDAFVMDVMSELQPTTTTTTSSTATTTTAVSTTTTTT